MDDSRETLEDRLATYEAQLRGLNSYINELNSRVAEHGTSREQVETDLLEAKSNVEYYEGEVARIRGELAEAPEGPVYFVYEDSSGDWRWQLRAANHRIIADSAEGYRNRQDCLHAIALVKDSKDAPVRDRRGAATGGY